MSGNGRHSRKPCTDHLGQNYPSLKAMCGSWPVRDPSNYLRRLKRGMTQREALTKRTRKPIQGPRPACTACGSRAVIANGYYPDGERRWCCKDCGHHFEADEYGRGRDHENLNAKRARLEREGRAGC